MATSMKVIAYPFVGCLHTKGEVGTGPLQPNRPGCCQGAGKADGLRRRRNHSLMTLVPAASR